MPRFSDDTIGMFLEVESRLDQTLPKAEKSYAKFIKRIIALNEEARRSLQSGMDMIGGGGGGGFTGPRIPRSSGMRQGGSSSAFTSRQGGGLEGLYKLIGQKGQADWHDTWQGMGWGDKGLPPGIADSATGLINNLFNVKQATAGVKVGAAGARSTLTAAIKDMDAAMKGLTRTTSQYDTKALRPVLDDLVKMRKEYANIKADILELNNLQSMGGFGKAMATTGKVLGGIAGGAGAVLGSLNTLFPDVPRINANAGDFARQQGISSSKAQQFFIDIMQRAGVSGLTSQEAQNAGYALGTTGARLRTSPQFVDEAGRLALEGRATGQDVYTLAGYHRTAGLLEGLPLDVQTQLIENINRAGQRTGGDTGIGLGAAFAPAFVAQLNQQKATASQKVMAQTNAAILTEATTAGGMPQFGAQLSSVLATGQNPMTQEGRQALAIINQLMGMTPEQTFSLLAQPGAPSEIVGRVRRNLQGMGKTWQQQQTVLQARGLTVSPQELQAFNNEGLENQVHAAIRDAEGNLVANPGDAFDALQREVRNAMPTGERMTNTVQNTLDTMFGGKGLEVIQDLESIAGSLLKITGPLLGIVAAFNNRALIGAILGGTLPQHMAEGAAGSAAATVGGAGVVGADAIGAATKGAGLLGSIGGWLEGLSPLALMYGATQMTHGSVLPTYTDDQQQKLDYWGKQRSGSQGFWANQWDKLFGGPPPDPDTLPDIPDSARKSSATTRPVSLLGTPSAVDLARMDHVADPTTHDLLRQLIAAVGSSRGANIPYAGSGTTARLPDPYFLGLMQGTA